MNWISKKEGNVLSQKKSGNSSVFARLDVFSAKTKFEIVLESFCEIEVGLRKFLSKEAERRKGVAVKIFCPSKREKRSKVKIVRRGLRNPVR